MAQYVYSRVSRDSQETANQLHVMREKFPGAAVVEETASGAKQRPELDALLAKLRPGDTLCVFALDRLGRRCGELVNLFDQLNRDGVILVSVREGIDLGTMGGKFVARIFAALAEMERELISSRTKTALAAKKAAGVKLGKPSKLTSEQQREVRALRASGETYPALAKRFGVGLATVHKVCKEATA